MQFAFMPLPVCGPGNYFRIFIMVFLATTRSYISLRVFVNFRNASYADINLSRRPFAWWLAKPNTCRIRLVAASHVTHCSRRDIPMFGSGGGASAGAGVYLLTELQGRCMNSSRRIQTMWITSSMPWFVASMSGRHLRRPPSSPAADWHTRPKPVRRAAKAGRKAWVTIATLRTQQSSQHREHQLQFTLTALPRNTCPMHPQRNHCQKHSSQHKRHPARALESRHPSSLLHVILALVDGQHSHFT